MSDIAELFDRDPLNLTKQDLMKIIESLRAQRANWNLGVKGAGSMKPKKKPVEKATAADIDDLLKGLKL